VVDLAVRNSTFQWSVPPKELGLESDEVHVWRASLNASTTCVKYFNSKLSVDELKRAEKFHFRRDRNRFIVARGRLRFILGSYLGIDPGQLIFRYSDYGKPIIAHEHGSNSLRFSVSHSHKLSLYAVTMGRELGIDLERIHPELADLNIAEQYFSPQEFAMLHALPNHLQTEAFFRFWTSKEAYIKAIGEGLAFPLHEIEVEVRPSEPTVPLRIKGDSLEASRWLLREIDIGAKYIAALAIKAHGWKLKCWQWIDH